MEKPRGFKHLGNPPRQDSGGGYAIKWGFPGTVQRPTILDLYSTQARNGIQNPHGKGWQAQNPEHRHPVLIKFMSRFLQKYVTPYFAKLLIAGKKTVRYLPKYWGNLHGKRDMCMHHILEKYRNPNCSFYHTQSK